MRYTIQHIRNLVTTETEYALRILWVIHILNQRIEIYKMTAVWLYEIWAMWPTLREFDSMTCSYYLMKSLPIYYNGRHCNKRTRKSCCCYSLPTSSRNAIFITFFCGKFLIMFLACTCTPKKFLLIEKWVLLNRILPLKQTVLLK